MLACPRSFSHATADDETSAAASTAVVEAVEVPPTEERADSAAEPLTPQPPDEPDVQLQAQAVERQEPCVAEQIAVPDATAQEPVMDSIVEPVSDHVCEVTQPQVSEPDVLAPVPDPVGDVTAQVSEPDVPAQVPVQVHPAGVSAQEPVMEPDLAQLPVESTVAAEASGWYCTLNSYAQCMSAVESTSKAKYSFWNLIRDLPGTVGTAFEACEHNGKESKDRGDVRLTRE